jgi:hypothetical protein
MSIYYKFSCTLLFREFRNFKKTQNANYNIRCNIFNWSFLEYLVLYNLLKLFRPLFIPDNSDSIA